MTPPVFSFFFFTLQLPFFPPLLERDTPIEVIVPPFFSLILGLSFPVRISLHFDSRLTHSSPPTWCVKFLARLQFFSVLLKEV